MRSLIISSALLCITSFVFGPQLRAQDTTRVPERDTVVYEDDFDEAFGDDVFRGSLGMRGGFALNPDQIALGVQSRFGALFGDVRLAPSFDVGFGDGVTLFSLNADLLLPLFTPPYSNARFYGALGPSLQIGTSKGAGTKTELGLSVSAGIRMPFSERNSYNLETRFGIGDIQDVRFLFGVLFGIRVDPNAPPSTTSSP